MIATPNTTVSILAGSTVNDWGDTAEGTTETLTGVPALIVAGRQIVSTESDQQAHAVRYYTGRIPAGTAVTDANRLRDDNTGEIYSVDYVEQPTGLVNPQDIRLDLRRVT